MARIGILGGSFNPIHNLHMELARAALIDYDLSEVRFVPAARPPHKEIADGCSLEDRIEMIRLAIMGEQGFVLDLYEVESREQTYTFSTLEHYHKAHPYDELFFIMGEDSADSFEYWVEPGKICSCATILVGQRAREYGPSEDISDDDYSYGVEGAVVLEQPFLNKLEKLSEKFSGNFLPLKSPKTNISSTMIRNFIKNNDPWPDFVPLPVAYYIQEKRIYNYVQ